METAAVTATLHPAFLFLIRFFSLFWHIVLEDGYLPPLASYHVNLSMSFYKKQTYATTHLFEDGGRALRERGRKTIRLYCLHF